MLSEPFVTLFLVTEVLEIFTLVGLLTLIAESINAFPVIVEF